MISAYPALDLWRRELRQGKRSPRTIDALWRVACREAAAREAAAIGSWDTWEHYMVDARQLATTLAGKQAA
jgi:hypothetical protein